MKRTITFLYMIPVLFAIFLMMSLTVQDVRADGEIPTNTGEPVVIQADTGD